MRNAEAIVRQVIFDHLDKRHGYELNALLQDELGADSLDLVQMLLLVEESKELNGATIDVWLLDNVKTVGQFVKLVQKFLPEETEHAKEQSNGTEAEYDKPSSTL